MVEKLKKYEREERHEEHESHAERETQSRALTPYDDDDGVAGWEDREEGEEQECGRKGPLEGREQIVFANDCRWSHKKGDEILPDREFLFEKVKRVLSYWGVDGKPTKKTRVLGPREKWPIVNGRQGLNELAPKSEWRPDPFNKGKKKPPYQQQWLAFLRDMKSGAPYVYATSTDGGHGAVHDLIMEIVYMRRRTKKFLSPILMLAKRWMSTQYGGRDAPRIVCNRWIGGDDGLVIGADSPKPLPPNADLSTSTFDNEGEPRRPMTKKGVQKITPSRNHQKDEEDEDFDDDLGI